MKITIYQKPSCTTCRQVYAALRDANVDFESVDYYVDPIPKARLKELVRKMGIRPGNCCGPPRSTTRPYASLSASSPRTRFST